MCQAHDYKQVITKDSDAERVISALTSVKALEK